jgi:hypothetical protein
LIIINLIELERKWSLPIGSIMSTLLSNEVRPQFERLERGETNLEDFEPFFARIYRSQASIDLLSKSEI